MNKLQKSVANYHRMVSTMELNPRSESFRKTLAYLRALYSEFGRNRVREAMKWTKS